MVVSSKDESFLEDSTSPFFSPVTENNKVSFKEVQNSSFPLIYLVLFNSAKNWGRKKRKTVLK